MASHSNWKKKFITICIGQAFSLLGSAAVQFAIIWWLTVQTESAVTLTFATLISTLPNIILGPFAGVWIDRYNRKTVMIAADGLVALSSAALGIAFLLTNAPPVWFVYLILCVRGLGNTFHSPALQAAIPLFVPAEMLMKAGGWGNLIASVSNLAGPALGAGLMSLFPIAPIMLVDILGAVFAILCLLTVTIPDIPRQSKELHFMEGVMADVKDGFAAMKRDRLLMTALPPILMATLLYMPLSSLLPLLVRVHYQGGEWHNAAVQLLFSVGLLAASLIIGLWGGAKRRFLMVSAAIMVMGAAAAASGRLPAAGFRGFAACSLIMGGSGTFFNVPLVAHIQENTAPEMMGKVISLLTSALTLSTPFGLLLAGPLSERVGVDVWFLWSGLIMLASGVICFVLTYPIENAVLSTKNETKIKK